MLSVDQSTTKEVLGLRDFSELEECMDEMFSFIAANVSHGYNPSCGSLPKNLVETCADSDDGKSLEPVESGSHSSCDFNGANKRKHSEKKSSQKKSSKKRSSGNRISPSISSAISRLGETITTSVATCSHRHASTPTVSEAMLEIQRLFKEDEELFAFAVEYVLVKAKREACMCMTEEQKVWRIVKHANAPKNDNN